MLKILKGLGNRLIVDNNLMTKELIAKLELIHLMPIYFPYSKYTVSYVDLNEICKSLILRNPNNILEFGSGLSTLVLSKLFCNYTNVKIFSIEHNFEWFKFMNKQIENNNLKNIKLIHSNLKKVEFESFSGNWYDLDFNKFPNFDAILIDGPPSNSKNFPYSRFFSKDVLLDKLNHLGYIYMDDVDRDAEKKILENWFNLGLINEVKIHKWGRGASIVKR